MRLSYSSISTYETCPAKYRFQYEERLPTTTSPALSFGDSLHRALRRFHDRPVPVAPSIEELHDILQSEWVSDGYRDPSEEQVYFDHANQVLADYHRANAGSFRPIEIRLPERSWLNAKWPSPTIGCTTLTSSKITAAIWKALSDAIPDRAVAPTFAECGGSNRSASPSITCCRESA